MTLFVLAFVLDKLCTARSCSRAIQVDLGVGGSAIGRMLGGVRGYDRFAFFCGSRVVSISGHIALGTRSLDVSSVLAAVLPGYDCAVSGGGVVVAIGRTNIRRRKGVIAKIIHSIGNRPIIKTGISMGNAAGKAVASVSKGFALRNISTSSGLSMSCVNCVTRRVMINGGKTFRVMLGSSARTLRRIIIINCTTRGGIGLAKSMTDLGFASRGLDHPIAAVTTSLSNVTTNIGIVGADDRPGTRNSSVLVHNINAVGSTNPLVLISKVRVDLGRIGPGSITSVSVLGSTTSYTVCNGEKTGKMVLIAAGHNSSKGVGIACSNGFSCRAPTGLVHRMASCTSCVRFIGRNCLGAGRTTGFSRSAVGR